MANEMRTYVTIKSDKPEVATRLQEIFKPREGEHEATAIDIINKIKGTDYSFQNETTKEDWNREVDFPSNDLWEEMIGPKWLYVQYDHQELPENCNIVLRTAWSVPAPFLNILRNELQKIDEDCYIRGTYEDEGYNPSGAFVYGKFDYDDMEDLDEEYDWNEADEDDFYNETWSEACMDLENDLVNAYLEYLEDRKNNPQDYE
jgi:hypothetical protein